MVNESGQQGAELGWKWKAVHVAVSQSHVCNTYLLFAWQINQMFAAFPPDVSGNLDYKNLCYVITHGEEKD